MQDRVATKNERVCEQRDGTMTSGWNPEVVRLKDGVLTIFARLRKGHSYVILA